MGDNEIPAHFIHEIEIKRYDVIGVSIFLRKLIKFLRKKGMHSGRPILLTLASLTSLTDNKRIHYKLKHWKIYVRRR